MENTLVSIIVPTYNVGNYVQRAIESSLNQTYKNIELILIDDGSTDETWEVLEHYALQDKRIVAKSQKNAGVSAARNCGLRLATGDYVLFLDSDDWIETNTVQMLLSMQYLHLDCLVSADCYYSYFDADGEIYRIKSEKRELEICASQEEALVAAASGEYKLISACYKLYSLKKIRENRICFDEGIRHGEDGLFVFNYLHYVKGFYYCTTPLWNILERPGSATTSGYNSHWLTAINAVEQMIGMEESNEVKEKLYCYLKSRTMMLLFVAAQSNDKVDEDIAFIRKKLFQLAKWYLPCNDSIRNKIRYLLSLIVPRSFIRVYMKKRKEKSSGVEK